MKKLIFILSLFALVSCKSTNQASVTPAEYQNRYGNVVLTEIVIPDQLVNRPEVAEYYKENVTKLLNSKGIKVHDSNIYLTTRKEVVDEFGGYIDTFTGEVDQAKRTQIELETLARLKSNHGIESVLYYEIRQRKANFGGYRAEWDGQTEPYELNNSDVTNFLSSLVMTTTGTTSALSLIVFIEDMSASHLYTGAGGIQLTSKLNGENEFVSVPINDLFTDENIMSFSINEAFKGILNEK
ncbi:hypothetical protein L2750_12730 [Shewanella submarina]|uniref:Lipoprotein n=1 Tax=Shewanella submarina TaxID=2016376 RepID=A0ABV7GHY2_9GAMM|nr:hypothetical protein [Shewanella submarina]MCL1038015.1 hypothetical protein [Shewanella submarina]